MESWFGSVLSSDVLGTSDQFSIDLSKVLKTLYLTAFDIYPVFVLLDLSNKLDSCLHCQFLPPS